MKNHRTYLACSLTAAPPITQRQGCSRALGSLALAAVMLIASCSGASSDPGPQSNGSVILIDDPVGSEPLPDVLELLQADPVLLAPVPDVAHTQTMADSGLQISYTKKSLMVMAPVGVIETQWVYMQSCVEQVSVPPVVLVREGPAVPFTQADDVVRNETITALEITSVPIASASTLYGPVIQVSVDDFDGSLGTPAFNLRSIMGRHLWLSANLPERDYPFDCARQQP